MITDLSFFLISAFGFLNLFGIKNQLLLNQLVFFAVGLVVFFIVRNKIGRGFFFENSQFFYWLLIFLLILVFFVGEEVRGAKRWINFYFFNFQPSEFFKIVFIIFLSNLYSKKNSFYSYRKVFFQGLSFFLLPFFLIYKQPDLGTAIIIAIIFFVLSLFSRLPKTYFFRLFFVLVLFIPLGWFFLADYQKLRILAFINPHLDQKGTTYNIIQSIIAIGAGGFFGKGLGLGTQTKLSFLPENHTDFAFASFIEQFGFFGGLIILIFYSLLFYSLIRLLFKKIGNSDHRSLVDFYYTLGFLTLLFSQVVINIFMNLGLAPVTGIPLPLISYGGSSLLSLIFGLALLSIND